MDRGYGKKRVKLPLILPWGVGGLRVPVLAVNWVHRIGGKVRVDSGNFPAILLDPKRIAPSVLEQLQKSGYSRQEHDAVLFFDRDEEGKAIKAEYGVVVRNTWKLWTAEAHKIAFKADRLICNTFQFNVENELSFGWLLCERCQKWRIFPSMDVTLPPDAAFWCALAANWNPRIKDCGSEQEFSVDDSQNVYVDIDEGA
jgi:hypothetical protein